MSEAMNNALKFLKKHKGPIAAITTVATLVIVFLVLWYGEGLRYRFYPKRWGAVTPGKIYRSARIEYPPLLEKTLKENGVKHIVNLCAAGPDNPPSAKPEAEIAKKLGITVHYVLMGGDGTCDKPEKYPEAVLSLVEAVRAGKPALVHCAAGTNRTGGVVAMYQVLVEGKSVKEAVEGMRLYKFNTKTNDTLFPFLNKNMPYFVNVLKMKGAIDKIPDPLPVFSAE